MLLRCSPRIVLSVFLFGILSLPTLTASADKVLKIGISPFTPFVISSGGKYTGFSVDLWDVIAQELDAVVYDVPNLLYFADGTAKGKVRVVGKIFAPQDYAIAVQQSSIWREKMNRVLLDLIESGGIRGIYNKWFGAENPP